MPIDRPVDGAGGASLACLCGCDTFKIICWCGNHTDVSCSKCGQVLDHKDLVIDHNIKVHKPGVTCAGCDDFNFKS